jgi:hypothetical protein
MFMYLYRASWHSSANLTESFSCFFLSCKTNVRVKPAKTGHGPHSSWLVNCVVLYIVSFVSFCVLFVCKCVLYYCHRVETQLQLTNISYHTISNKITLPCLRLAAGSHQPQNNSRHEKNSVLITVTQVGDIASSFLVGKGEGGRATQGGLRGGCSPPAVTQPDFEISFNCFSTFTAMSELLYLISMQNIP